MYSVSFSEKLDRLIVTYKDVNTLASLRCKSFNNDVEGFNQLVDILKGPLRLQDSMNAFNFMSSGLP